jgi:CRISPR-associated protein Csx3
MNLLPAVLVGGPPHAGKSVLFYRLTRALREQGIEHYALRACPDGEGNWSHEGPSELMSTLRIKLTSEWPPAFIQSISQALENRCLPFLVDMGGDPRPSQECLLKLCSRSILLLREDKPEATLHWQHLVERYNLLPLARLTSRLTGTSVITSDSPILEGIVTGLERSTASARDEENQLFQALFMCIATLFTSYDSQQQRSFHLERASTELTLDLQEELYTFTATSRRWEPEMLRPLLDRLPGPTPLSVYGIGPSWLYAALAVHTDPQPFYLFDPKLPFGWIQPISVRHGEEPAQASEIAITTRETPGCTILRIRFPHDRLEYFQPEPLAFPPIPCVNGVIIDGRLPYWLLAALVRLYKQAGVAWIAPYYPPSQQAVVVFSRQEFRRAGELVPLPAW